MEHILRVDDEELRLLQAAVSSFVKDFGHDEMDVLRPAKALRQRLDREISLTPISAAPAASSSQP